MFACVLYVLDKTVVRDFLIMAIYNHGIVTVGEKSVIPDNISIGKNSVVFGVTSAADYENSVLASGKTLIKAGEQ